MLCSTGVFASGYFAVAYDARASYHAWAALALSNDSESVMHQATLRRLLTMLVPATMRGLLWHFRLPCEGCLLAHYNCFVYHTSGYSAEASYDVSASYHAWAARALQATLRGLPSCAPQLFSFSCVGLLCGGCL